MNDRSVSRSGTLSARMFAWIVIGTLVAFFVNNVLLVAFDFPPIGFGNDSEGSNMIQLAIYGAGVIFGIGKVFSHSEDTLRQDAELVTNINRTIIRICFWIVLLTGVADALLAFMRVENLLIYFVDKKTVASLGFPNFVVPYVHAPLMVLWVVLGLYTRTLGFFWLALMIVAAELMIVLTRFVFSYEQALMGDLVRYWYAALFLFASAHTLYDEGHVRVDLLYANFARRTKGYTNSIGSLVWGISTCVVILFIGMGSKQSIINSPLAVFEVTQAGNIGMFIKYKMAAFLAIFAGTMLIQFVSYFIESIADIRNEPGARVTAAVVQ